ncbi:MAG: sporulation protein Cse60 [Candidatus Njordarchaeales archaeon]
MARIYKVKIFSERHASGTYAWKQVEEKVNNFLTNELPKIGGELIDIKMTSAAVERMYLVAAMVIYTIEKDSD